MGHGWPPLKWCVSIDCQCPKQKTCFNTQNDAGKQFTGSTAMGSLLCLRHSLGLLAFAVVWQPSALLGLHRPP
jgi:hypothetical protein